MKQRGLLEDMKKVIWGGEFDALPMAENRDESNAFKGRDHHAEADCMWMAGVLEEYLWHTARCRKRSEIGYTVTNGRVNPHDIQATTSIAIMQ